MNKKRFSNSFLYAIINIDNNKIGCFRLFSSIISEGVTEMIIVNTFVDFCILVLKGISLLLNGLFRLLKIIVLTPLAIISNAFKGLVVVISIISKGFITILKGVFSVLKTIILGTIRIIKVVINFLFKYFIISCNFIKKIILIIGKKIGNFLKLILNVVVNLLKYIAIGLEVIIGFIYKTILIVLKTIFKFLISIIKKIWIGFMFVLLHSIAGMKIIFSNLFKVFSYVVNKIFWIIGKAGKFVGLVVITIGKGFMMVAATVYNFILYVLRGIMTSGITIFNIIMFIPKYIVKSIINLITNFRATINRFILEPIQNIADFFVKTFKNIKAKIIALPTDIKKRFYDWYNELTFVKHRKNKRDMNRQILLIDFNSTDAKRSDRKIVFQYYAKDHDGKLVRGIFEAFSKLDLHSFLMSEGYEVYDIKTSKSIEFFYGGRNSSTKKIKSKKMVFFLTQLSTYIRAGIPLTDSVRILSRQEKNPKMQRLYQSIIYELIMGENFSIALEKQGEAFPRLLVNMLKTSEMTGELAETLDDMADYYSTTEKLKKQTLTSMMYPMVVMFFVIVVVIFIMIYVIPQFIEIYKNSDATLPAITVITISISAFLKQNIVFLIIGIILFALLFRFLFKNVKLFKTIVQWIVMHIPVIKNIIIYNEITMFTKTFSELLKHNVFITDSMEILSKITNNEIYKMIVFDSISNIARGDNISSSFKNHWAIPPLAYEMMLTGERTGQLPLMMGKVAIYFQEEQKNLVNQVKTLVEPIVIVFLALTVGLILLAVVVPMFSLYSDLSTGV